MPGSVSAAAHSGSELLHPQYGGLSVAEVLELERAEMMLRR
jgi:hypothetical protein